MAKGVIVAPQAETMEGGPVMLREGADCPVAVVYRASWPDQRIIRGTLADIRDKVRAAKITRTALVLVGRVLDETAFSDSSLYDPKHVHVLRPKRRA